MGRGCGKCTFGGEYKKINSNSENFQEAKLLLGKALPSGPPLVAGLGTFESYAST